MDAIKLRALKTFHSPGLGHFRHGNVFHATPQYADEMCRIGNAERMIEPLEPPKRQAIASAPLGKDEPAASTPALPKSPNSADSEADGQATPSRSSRAGRRSRPRTSSTSEESAE